MQSPLEQLAHLFTKFPGIGRRQAKRFAYFLVQSDPEFVDELQRKITETRATVRRCSVSFQYFTTADPQITTSPIVRDPNRDFSELMIVEKDQDIEAFEKSKAYHGQYFVIGSLEYLLDTEIDQSARVRSLINLVNERIKNNLLREIIFALPVNPDGDRLAAMLQQKIISTLGQYNLKISQLGRGFSTGAEVEYADTETLSGAFANRK